MDRGETPERFGRYRILKTLGKGGMGTVYLAEDPDLDRLLAIKVPSVDSTDKSSVLERFRHEARSIAQIHHPNICPIYDVSEVDGVPYMAMAFVEGKPLNQFIRPEKPLPVREVVKLVRVLALTLQHAHEVGIIHRDLKPANIIINNKNQPVIMDFGLARRKGKSDTQLTTAGQIIGTPNYMSPEQVSGIAERMGPNCDIYSLGVIMYEMLTGRVLFQGDLLAVLSAIANEQPAPPSTRRSEISADLDAICLKATAKQPEDRFASMAEFANALNQYLQGTGSGEASGISANMTVHGEGSRVKSPNGLTEGPADAEELPATITASKSSLQINTSSLTSDDAAVKEPNPENLSNDSSLVLPELQDSSETAGQTDNDQLSFASPDRADDSVACDQESESLAELAPADVDDVPEASSPDNEVQSPIDQFPPIRLEEFGRPERIDEMLDNWLTDDDKAVESQPLESEFPTAKPSNDESKPTTEQVQEFQFECPLCHTFIPASTLQIGEVVNCVDCESSIKVPQPAQAALRPVGTFFQMDDAGKITDGEFKIGDPVDLPKFEMPDIDLLGEEDSLLSAPRSRPVSTSNSADGRNLLEPVPPNTGTRETGLPASPSASRPLSPKALEGEGKSEETGQTATAPSAESVSESGRLGIGSLGEFLAFMAHPEFILRWITLTLILTGEFLLVRYTISCFLSSDLSTRIIGYPLIFPTILFALVYALVSFVFQLSVLERTSAGQRTVDQWPEFEFFVWLSRSFFVLTCFWLSSLPGLVISMLFVFLSFWYWIAAPCIAISFFIFFPFLLFSVISNQHAWNPVSLAVWNSLKTCRARWQRFYAYSGLILLASVPLMLLPLFPNFFTSLIAATGFVFLSFAYFRLLGYLGRNLFEHLDVSDRI